MTKSCNGSERDFLFSVFVERHPAKGWIVSADKDMDLPYHETDTKHEALRVARVWAKAWAKDNGHMTCVYADGNGAGCYGPSSKPRRKGRR